MRQLILKVPKGHTEQVLQAVNNHKGKNTISLQSQDQDVFIIFLPNNRVNNFLSALEEIDSKEINLIPRGIINLYPPAEEAPDQVADVHPKSSLEIYLGGVQSVGSLFSLLGYSLAAGIIVWIGMFTTTIYLLVAAMLVAPFAGPAMNAALATAAGKSGLLKSSLKRYALAMLTAIAVSFVLSAIFSLQLLTPLMVEVSQVSKFALFLPLISGFAGAINICQSERSSLVSGAAVGILVAASLAPPAGLLGAGLYLQNWEVVSSSLFRIVLQLLGIHLSATLVFVFYGKVTPDGIRFLKGSTLLQCLTSLVVLLGIGGMMFWQFSNLPYLRKSSMNTEITEALNNELGKLPYIEVLNKSASFTNTEYKGKPVVNLQATVLPRDTVPAPSKLQGLIIQHLKQSLRYHPDELYLVYEITVVQD